MDSITALNPSIPATYGRACTTCAHAKAKCVYANGLLKCERCLRLQKECHPSPNARGSRIKKKSNTKTARLEEKLDGLVSLLTSASQPHTGQGTTPALVDASSAAAQFGASPESLGSRVASPGREGNGEDFSLFDMPISIHRSITIAHGTIGKKSKLRGQEAPPKDADFPSTQNVYFPDIKDYCGDSYIQDSRNSSTRYRMSALFSDEAEESLNLFRVQLMARFPFMIIQGQ